MTATTVTLEDFWQLFRESERLRREGAAEVDRMFKETDRRFEEVARQSAETDRQIKNTDYKLKDLAKQVGNLASRWGEFVEGVVAPGCKTIFAERGIPVHEVHRRVERRTDDGRTMEIDILVVNDSAAVLVEVKSKLTVEDVRDHLNRLQNFKSIFIRYADTRVMGAVAGIVCEENAEQFARNQGLFVIVQSGETICLANEKTFVPRIW